MNGDMWHLPITLQVPHGVVITTPFTSLVISRGEHPPCTFLGCPEAQILGLPTAWGDYIMGSSPRSGSRVPVPPATAIPTSSPSQPAPCTGASSRSQTHPLQPEGK